MNEKELTKQDSTQTKGLAAIFMVLLHLFCVKTDLPFTAILLPSGVPLVYYLGLFGDQCVAIYCFCSGYAHFLIRQKHTSASSYYRTMGRQLLTFLIQFWTVLLLCTIVGILSDNPSVPGKLTAFLGNFFLYQLTYCGPWWFVLTYVFLVLSSGFVCFLCTKLHPVLMIILSGALYFLTYLQRYHPMISVSDPVLSFCLNQFVLYGNSVFPYTIGVLFRKYAVISKIRSVLEQKKISKTLIVVLGLTVEFAMLAAHGIVESAIVAPAIAIVTVTVLNIVPKSKPTCTVLGFLGRHSTNIWLVHYLFIGTAFPAIAYVVRYPVPILIWTMALSIGVSYGVNALCVPIQKRIRRKPPEIEKVAKNT